MNQELTLIEKLDLVLKYLEKQKHPPIKTIGEITKDLSLPLSTDESELLLILNKLIKDGYVDPEDREHFSNPYLSVSSLRRYYIITFEGKLFNLKGGYSEQLEILDSEHNKAIRSEHWNTENSAKLTKLTFWIAIPTVIAALATFGLLIMEIIKYLSNSGK